MLLEFHIAKLCKSLNLGFRIFKPKIIRRKPLETLSFAKLGEFRNYTV